MKIVLLKDVRDMGHAGSVHDVSDGHAMNLLIPRKLAVSATPAAIKRAEEAAKHQKERKELDAKLVSERVSALAEERTVIVKKANEQGHLYDGVGVAEIAAAAQLPEEVIRLEKPLKELGTFEIPVSAGQDFGSITIVIEAE